MNDLYRSSIFKGSYFSKMLHCGAQDNVYIERALRCLPVSLFDQHKDNLAFVSTRTCDAFRLARALCRSREIVVLSERIFPKACTPEGDAEVRYFTFVVLHEVAHAIRQHCPPNEITPEQNDIQEDVANNLAFQWFNDHLISRNNPDLHEFTRDELERAQARSKRIAAEYCNA